MIRIVDRVGNLAVQKVIHPKGHTVRYQVVKMENSKIEVLHFCDHLAAARVHLGKLPKLAKVK